MTVQPLNRSERRKKERERRPRSFSFPAQSRGMLSGEAGRENGSVADTPCQNDESCQSSNLPILLTYDMIDFPSEFSNTRLSFPLAPTHTGQVNVHLSLFPFSPSLLQGPEGFPMWTTIAGWWVCVCGRGGEFESTIFSLSITSG